MNRVSKLLDILFVVSVIIFVSMSVIMLLLQCVGLVTLDGSLAAGAYNVLTPWSGIVSTVSALSAIVLSYLRRGFDKEDS